MRICLPLLIAGLFLLPGPLLAQAGDPQRGEALYVGTLAFAAGGAPCLACHGIAGAGPGQPFDLLQHLAVSGSGDAVVVNDNDGVDDSNGETQLIHLPDLF
jgi:mono/diheme cytochrome c family protein